MRDNMRSYGIFLLTFFVIGSRLWVSPVEAQDELEFDRLSIDQGLSQSTVTAICQDRRGFMWFGTQDGLNKYDGYTFTVYKHIPQDSTSLSHNYIRSIYEDREGFLWLGTIGGGLNKFDPTTGIFTRFQADPNNPHSLSSNLINPICEDRDGNLWLGTYGGGLNKLDRQTGRFTHYKSAAGDSNSLSDNTLYSLCQDRQGFIWIGTQKGGLNRFDPVAQTFRHFKADAKNAGSLTDNFVPVVYEDSRGLLWVGTSAGLNCLNRETMTFTRYLRDAADPHSIGGNSISSIREDADGVMWFGTYDGGLNRLDPDAQDKAVFTRFGYDPEDPLSLSGNQVLAQCFDVAGILWLGTDQGVSRINPARARFSHYQHRPGNENSLSYKTVTALQVDRTGLTWVGTENGLNSLDLSTKKFTRYKNEPDNPFSISSNRISAIYEDRAGVLWVGTRDQGLNKFDPVTRRFIRYQRDADNPKSFGGGAIVSFYEDSLGYFWIGTLYGGLNRFDRHTETFDHFKHAPDNSQSISNDFVLSICGDHTGTLWLGTGTGLNRFERDGQTFRRYLHDPKNPHSLSHDRVSCIYEDTTGRLWLGTSGGLNLLDRASDTFTAFTEKDGLPNDVIQGILEDDDGNLWLSTNKGLSSFNPQTKTFRNFDAADGLQSNEFSPGACLRNQAGKLLFGGTNGLTVFDPKQIKDNPYIPPVVITVFSLFNKPVAVGSDSPLKKQITATNAIVLSYRQSVFSLQFAALNYTLPTKNQYAYQMEGFDSDWVTAGAKRDVTYTNLNPGEYTFRVKGSNNDGLWNETGASLKITITPPLWKTWWAYSFYALLIIGAIVGFVHYQQIKVERKQKELEREHAIAEQLRRVDKLKDEFLANTSHELRTPLNGIIGLAESLLDGVAGILPDKAHFDLKMISASGRRLSNLVNDILDFSKMIDNRIELSLKPVNLHAIVEFVLALSQPLVGKKELKLINAVSPDLPPLTADENRLQQIVQNLVGNAIKFTEKGEIRVSSEALIVNSSEQQRLTTNAKLLTISVADTGIGIANDKLEEIFKSFVQADGSVAREYGGTGLGLAITKNLVELHGGTISVKSKLGEGSQFTVTLPSAFSDPSSASSFQPAIISSQPAAISDQPAVVSFQPATGARSVIESAEPKSESWKLKTKSLLTILVVDDEPVNQHVLGNFLSLKNYKIAQAMNGLEALKLVEDGLKPDLILLDVMMPKMSGYEVCRKIREKYPHREVPVILLTAKNQEGDIQEGFDAGANDYVTKPFHRSELLARIQTHIHVARTAELEAENRRKNNELERARDIQASMLPLSVPLVAGLEIAAYMQPALMVGGDYYDFIPSPDGQKVYIVIADVSGKGLPASLLTIEARSVLHTLAADNPSPHEMLLRLNRMIYKDVQNMSQPMMITMLLLVWDMTDSQLYYAGAGHDPLLVYRKSSGQCEVVFGEGIWLGILDEMADFLKIKQLPLQSGDLVMLYTDGVTEYHNPRKEMFGLERLMAFLKKHPITRPDDTITCLMAELERFGEGAPQHDDITVVAIQRM